MAGDSSLPTLGRLTPVPPREVWPREAHSFTPWLLNNVDVLSDLLGMDLALEVAEHPVGGFSLDLMGRDETTGEVVIVEDQLETSDHGHLGQILTYAAGTNPTTIVWVAAAFRPEHRAAIDWLNARTDEDTRYFGVELGVVRIGQSELAPLFRLVAQPNDWEKTVRTATNQAEATGKQVLYRAFWARWINLLHAERPAWSRATRPPRDSWFSMTTGAAGATHYTSFTKRGRSSELVFESPDGLVNTTRFHALRAPREQMEAVYGGALEWQDLPGRKATRVAEYLPDTDVTIGAVGPLPDLAAGSANAPSPRVGSGRWRPRTGERVVPEVAPQPAPSRVAAVSPEDRRRWPSAQRVADQEVYGGFAFLLSCIPVTNWICLSRSKWPWRGRPDGAAPKRCDSRAGRRDRAGTRGIQRHEKGSNRGLPPPDFEPTLTA